MSILGYPLPVFRQCLDVGVRRSPSVRALKRIGEGGFGKVFQALTTDNSLVAVKVLHKPIAYQDISYRDLIKNEVDILVKITATALFNNQMGRDTFLTTIFESFDDTDNIYLVMVSSQVT